MAKKEVTEFEAARRKRRAGFAFARIKKLLGAVLILVFIIGAVWLCVANDVFGMIGDRAAAFTSGEESMPVEMTGSSVRELFTCNGNIGVLTDGTLSLYATNGKTLLEYSHGMANPVAEAEGRKILLYDQGGKKLVVRTRNQVLFEKEFEYTIISATLSQDGWLTVITTAQRYTSQLHVWDSEYGDELLTWSASEEYIVLAAADPETKTVAALSVTANADGEIVTGLHVLTTEADVRLCSVTFDDAAPLSIAYNSAGNVKILCSGFAATVDREGNVLGKYEFSGNLIDCINAPGKNSLTLIFDRYTEARATDIVFLGENSEEKANVAVSGKYVSADGTGDRTALYCSGTLSVFDGNGKRSASADSEQDAKKITLCGDSVFAVTRDELCRLG